MAQHALTAPRPIMSAMQEFAYTAPVMPDCTLAMLMQPVTGGTPSRPAPVMSVHAEHGCTPAVSLHPMSSGAPAVPMPAVHECTHATSMHPISDCVSTVSMQAMSKPTWPVSDCTLTAPGPVSSGLHACTYTTSTASQSVVPGPASPVGKPQPHTSSLVAQPPTPPAPAVSQPQVVLIKQYQQPKPYTGATSWEGYKEYFERLAAVNGWVTPEQRAEQLALALEGPATEVLRGLDTSLPQAYNTIWEALARRFGFLDGARETMRRFDSRRQEDSESIPDFEQALRTLHREAWPTATPEH